MVYDVNTLNEELVIDFVNWMNIPNSKYRFMSTVLAARYAAKLKHRLPISLLQLLLYGVTMIRCDTITVRQTI